MTPRGSIVLSLRPPKRRLIKLLQVYWSHLEWFSRNKTCIKSMQIDETFLKFHERQFIASGTSTTWPVYDMCPISLLSSLAQLFITKLGIS